MNTVHDLWRLAAVWLGAACLLAGAAGAHAHDFDEDDEDDDEIALVAPEAKKDRKRTVVIEDVEIPTVGGASVPGLLGYVKGRKPKRLVVFCHGYGHTVQRSWRHHVARTVRPDTAVIAANYRADTDFRFHPTTAAYTAVGGALDTIEATRYAKARFPKVKTVYLLGISMGGGVSGIAIVESAKQSPDGRSLYDYWINVEGVANLYETWLEATLFRHPAAPAIEKEAGGTPHSSPEANAHYQRGSPVLLTRQMKAAGLNAAVVVHASLNDGVVPSNQGREMATALAVAGVPTHFFQVVRDKDDSVTPPGNRGSVALLGPVPEAVRPEDPNRTLGLYLTGHGTESEYDHPVIRTGFEQLEKMLDGTYVIEPYNETVVDDGSGPP